MNSIAQIAALVDLDLLASSVANHITVEIAFLINVMQSIRVVDYNNSRTRFAAKTDRYVRTSIGCTHIYTKGTIDIAPNTLYDWKHTRLRCDICRPSWKPHHIPLPAGLSVLFYDQFGVYTLYLCASCSDELIATSRWYTSSWRQRISSLDHYKQNRDIIDRIHKYRCGHKSKVLLLIKIVGRSYTYRNWDIVRYITRLYFDAWISNNTR